MNKDIFRPGKDITNLHTRRTSPARCGDWSNEEIYDLTLSPQGLSLNRCLAASSRRDGMIAPELGGDDFGCLVFGRRLADGNFSAGDTYRFRTSASSLWKSQWRARPQRIRTVFSELLRKTLSTRRVLRNNG